MTPERERSVSRDLGPLHAMLCPKCDGEGNDGDLLWPRNCDECAGTGLVPMCDHDCDCDACLADVGDE